MGRKSRANEKTVNVKAREREEGGDEILPSADPI
jgi:hypothetical protein